MPPIFATMKGASSGLTRKTTRTSNCIVKPSFEITSKGLKVLTTSPEVHSSLVGCRNDDRRNGQRVHVVTTGADDGFLNAAITFGHDVGFVRAFIKPPVVRIAGH